MSLTRFQIDDRIHLDARRAAWLPLSRCLAVADLHLGEAWVRRARGQLVPLGVADTTVSRLRSLMEAYRPERVVLLGDIVHGALPLEGIREAVGDLVALGREGVRIHWCLGNHDRNLPRQLGRWGWSVDTTPRVILPEAVLDHGDRPTEPWPTDPAVPEWHLHGHLHPALMLDDGVASRAKVPCFLIARSRPGRPDRIVLPAFSEMAAGSVVDRRGVPQGLGPEDRFDSAVACLGPRLLRIPFEG